MAVAGHNSTGGIETWSDERLVKRCLGGDESAWSALIGRYKNLIYSIPIRYGFSRDDAGDIFQQVCLQLLEALPTLREPKSLPAWLIKITSHASLRWARQERHYEPMGEAGQEARLPASGGLPEALLRELEQEEILHAALAAIPPRCRELIRLLFLEHPAVPYEEVAKSLGLAKGSIGFVRMRCLKRLRRILEEKQFR